MLPPPVTAVIGRRSGVGVRVAVRVGVEVFVRVGVGGVPVRVGVGVDGVGVRVGVGGTGVGVGGTPQLIVYCVPPRAMSRLAFAWEVKVEPRRPTRTEPGPMAGPCVTKGLSLLAATLTMIRSFTVSKEPLSALPCDVYVIEPSEFRAAVPKVKGPTVASVGARTKNWS